MLKESGYKGEKIVIMAPTDLLSIAQLPLVTAPLLREIGFNVDLQTMDWQTLVGRRAKKDPIDQGGWHIFHTSWYVRSEAHTSELQSLMRISYAVFCSKKK